MDPRPSQPRRRHDGWTPERQARFLATLESTGCVGAAAAAAGKSRAGAYRFRDRSDGARFGRLWELALRRRSERLLIAKLTAAPRQRSGVLATRFAFPLGERDEGDGAGKTSPHRQIRQTCRLPPERKAYLREVMEAGSRAPLAGPLVKP